MTRYQLAKLVHWAGTLRTRKRLQKTVFLLQEAGASFGLKFRLHYYGPYSQELADMVAESASLDLVQESSQGNWPGMRYSYSLGTDVDKSLEEYEETSQGGQACRELKKSKPLFDRLQAADLCVLELAATIAYFRSRRSLALQDALEATRLFKDESGDGHDMQRASELADVVLSQSE